MSIADKLATIRKQAAELNHKTDELNATIVHIDEGLRGTGVEFWWDDQEFAPENGQAPDSNDEFLRERTFYSLGYAKVGDTWCLATRKVLATEDTEDQWVLMIGDPTPLTRAPRHVRIAVADKLEEFLDAQIAANAQMCGALDRANALVRGETVRPIPRVPL